MKANRPFIFAEQSKLKKLTAFRMTQALVFYISHSIIWNKKNVYVAAIGGFYGYLKTICQYISSVVEIEHHLKNLLAVIAI